MAKGLFAGMMLKDIKLTSSYNSFANEANVGVILMLNNFTEPIICRILCVCGKGSNRVEICIVVNQCGCFN